MNVSKRLISNYLMFFGQIRCFFRKYYTRLREKFGGNFSETTFLCVEKKMMDKVLFNVLPFKIDCHLFYSCRGFNTTDKCIYCTRFNVENIALANYLDKKFTFISRDFLKDFCPEHFPEKTMLNFYYGGILFTDKQTTLCNHNHTNFGVLFYEHVDQSFTLYYFYLEIFARVAFNNLNKKILPIPFKGFNDTEKNKKIFL